MTDPDGPLFPMASVPYPASKAALNMVTAMYAKELRDTPIKVNAANPGYCATDLNGHRGFRTPEQGAGSCAAGHAACRAGRMACSGDTCGPPAAPARTACCPGDRPRPPGHSSMREPMTRVRSRGSWKYSVASAVIRDVARKRRLRHRLRPGVLPRYRSMRDRK